MYMKKYIFLAASALALASCTSDDFLGNTPENVQSNTSAINFDGGTGKISRTTTQRGEDAATSLGNNYVVVGFKGNETTKANATTYAFDHYNVNYKKQTAGTTTSNTADWEYVGQDMKVKGTNPAAALAEKAQTQTIKYWDNSCSSYDFLAFSMGKGYTSTEAGTPEYATPSQVAKDKLASAAYTLKGNVNTLSECYISDIKTVEKAAYKANAVEMQFRHLTSKVRIALYENVPGYVISDVKFHTDSYSNGEYTEGQTKGVLYGTFNNAGTLTVSFPTTGTDNKKKSDYNKAHVSFSPEATNGTVNKVEFDNVNYECQKEDQIADKSEFLSQSAATPSYCGGYINVLPAETNSSPANLRIDYKLTATDGSGEEINVKNAKATVPTQYTAWKHGYAYTYIFKIAENTNGTTGTPGTDDTGLTAISFNAVVLDDEETGKQETITTDSDPSITTYGFNKKNNDVTTGKDEYEAGTDIYATAFVPAYTDKDNTKHEATTAAPQNLFTVTIEEGAAQTINETSVANALKNGKRDETAKTYTITDASGKNMVITDATGTIVNSVPTKDGHNLSVNALKWTGTASTIYAVEYTYGDNKDKKAYKIVTVK